MQAFKCDRILTTNGFTAGYLIIDGEKIHSIAATLPAQFNGPVEEIKDAAILPGVVDTHVHVNEPGRTEWEGYVTATKAAAAGGITTVVDMPLNCLPVTTSKEALDLKLHALKDELWCDVGFWGGVIPENADNTDILEDLLKAGVLGVKSFLIDSGIEEFPPVNRAHLEKAMPVLARHKVPYLIHAEVDNGKAVTSGDPKDYTAFLNSRPRSFENDAIDMMLELSDLTDCHTHIVHLSSSDSLEKIRQYKRRGVPVSVETCPHYLTFHSEMIGKGETLYKCCPPIRERENKDLLWKGIKEGVIDFIVSDHSPCTPALKLLEEGDIEHAWGGISSLQFSFSLIWTEGRLRRFTLEEISKLMSFRPAKQMGLIHKKGRLAPGMDADFFIFDSEKKFTIGPDKIHFKHKTTPYNGREVYGVVEKTYLRGQKIFDRGNFALQAPGRPLLKETQKG